MEDRHPSACIVILSQLTQQEQQQQRVTAARETNCYCSSWQNSAPRFRKGTTRMQLQRTTITRRRRSAAIAFLTVGSLLMKSSDCIVSSFAISITDRCGSTKSRSCSGLQQSAIAPLWPIDERLFLEDDGGYSENNEAKALGIGPSPTHMEHDVSDILNSIRGDDHNHHHEVQSIDAAATATATTTTTIGSSPRMVLAEQRRRAMAAELLRNRKIRTSTIGSASVVRSSTSTSTSKRTTTTERVLDAIRRSALLRPAGAVGVLDDKKNKTIKTTTSDSQKDNANAPTAAARVTRSVIQSAIEEIMESQHSATRVNHSPDDASSSLFSTTSSRNSSFVGKSIGVLGDQQDWKALKDRKDMSKLTIVETNNNVLIRMASSLDDVDIANLRLSVFADCSLHERSLFCARSCLAMAARRKRGASCLVATRPAATTTTTGESPLVLGSVECSFHEFYGTQLGKRRKQHSVLYVTEVAVSPSARRQGIGSSLLQAVDILAKKRSIETLYLHVDVANEGAIELYKKAGYSRVANATMFQEFTRSLNLHPGATKGRDHFLFFKNLTPCPIWLDSVEMERQKRHRSDGNKLLEVFGFEIPA